MIINGENAVLGRLATRVATELKKGNEIKVINCGKIIITGNPNKIIGHYLNKRRKGSPLHGPFYPKRPDLLVRRTIRGMLPYKRKSGAALMKRLKLYIGRLEESKSDNEVIFPLKRVKTRFITIEKLCKHLGWSE